MTYLLLALIAGLLIDRWLMTRRHDRDRTDDRELNKVVVGFAERTNTRMAVQAEETRAQVSEMANRIQHPELLRPDIGETDYTPAPPTYDDEYHMVGKILPDSENGDVNG